MAAHVGSEVPTGKHTAAPTEDVEGTVFDATSALLDERIGESSDVAAWVTSTEIAASTGLERDVVITALEDLSADKLHVAPIPGLHDVEVLGVRHDLEPTEKPTGEQAAAPEPV